MLGAPRRFLDETLLVLLDSDARVVPALRCDFILNEPVSQKIVFQKTYINSILVNFMTETFLVIQSFLGF